jgi:hypothetical protein
VYLTEGALPFRSRGQVAAWECGLAHPVAPCAQCRVRGGGGGGKKMVDAPGLSYQRIQLHLSFTATQSSFNKILDPDRERIQSAASVP